VVLIVGIILCMIISDGRDVMEENLTMIMYES